MTNGSTRLHLLFVSDEMMEGMFAVEGLNTAVRGDEPWPAVARILEKRLTIDLADPANANVRIFVDNEDFSYLAPHPESGTYTTISSLVAIHESWMAGFNGLSHEVQYRYGMLIGSIGNLMNSLAKHEQARRVKAA